MAIVDKRVTKIEAKPWNSGKVYFDIECTKERAADGVHSYRFKTYMIGILRSNGSEVEAIQLASDNEAELLLAFEEELRGVKWLGFSATRDFDVMVLAGRWTSARKKLAAAPRAMYPFIDWSKLGIELANLRKQWQGLTPIERSGDVNGFDCMREWVKGDRENCWSHNLLDLREYAKWIGED